MIVWISPSKFSVGGAAMFLVASRNHHKVRTGRTDIIPFITKSLRDLVRS